MKNTAMNYLKYYVLAILFIFLMSCTQKGAYRPGVVARVNETYLSLEDLEAFIPNGTPKEDSLVMIKNYMDKWATQQLLLDAAAINLSSDKKMEIEELVEKFRADMLTNAYLERLVQQKVDTLIRESDIRNYYDSHKEKLLTDDVLVQLRYVNVMNGNPKMNIIKKYFLSEKKEDFAKLEDLSLQMKSYALNDSVWVSMDQVYERLPFITSENMMAYLADNLFYEVKDTVSTYMVKVYKVLNKNEVVPYEFIKPTLKMMLANGRKMELLKKTQKDILEDAIKNKRYEVYQ